VKHINKPRPADFMCYLVTLKAIMVFQGGTVNQYAYRDALDAKGCPTNY